jgi:hypothetical protein
MDFKLIAAFAALFLIVSGVALVAAQVIFPARFQNMEKDFNISNVHLKTNVVGLGVILLGFLLLLAQDGFNFFGR